MKNTYRFFCGLTLSLLIFAGCKSDENPVTPNAGNSPRKVSAKVVDVPQSLQNQANNQNSPWAGVAVAFIGQANALSGYLGAMEPQGSPLPKLNGVDQDWTWNDGQGNIYILSVTEDATNYYWSFKVNGITYISAQESLNGSTGNMNIYDIDNPTQPVLSYSWTFDSSGNYNLVMMTPETNITIQVNADGSGFVKVIESGVRVLEVTWTANGTGSWYYNGNSGSW